MIKMSLPIELLQFLGLPARAENRSENFCTRGQTDEILEMFSEDLNSMASQNKSQRNKKQVSNLLAGNFSEDIQESARTAGILFFQSAISATGVEGDQEEQQGSVAFIKAFVKGKWEHFTLLMKLTYKLQKRTFLRSSADKYLFPVSCLRFFLGLFLSYVEGILKIAAAFSMYLFGQFFRCAATGADPAFILILGFFLLAVPAYCVYVFANGISCLRYLLDGVFNLLSTFIAKCCCKEESEQHPSFATCFYAIVKNSILLSPYIYFPWFIGFSSIPLLIFGGLLLQIANAGVRTLFEAIEFYFIPQAKTNYFPATSNREDDNRDALHPVPTQDVYANVDFSSLREDSQITITTTPSTNDAQSLDENLTLQHGTT